MAINSRRKGKVRELDAVKYLKSLGFTAQRSQQYNGLGDADVLVKELPNLHVEVGSTEGMDVGTELLLAKCRQADRDSDGPWCVLWRPNRKQWRLSYETSHGAIATVCGDVDVAMMLRVLARRTV